MSKDIWHTVDETPKPYEDVAFYVDGYLYFSIYQPQHNQYGIFGADKIVKWCYAKDLSSYIPALENDLDRTHKALDVAKDVLKYANKCIKGGCVNWETEIDKALEQITALEQGGDNGSNS